MPADPYISELMLFAGTFEPQNWAFCNGQLLSIASNPALFSVIGTTYGGDGVNTFGLPDLRGRAPIHFGQGSGLNNYFFGQMGGAESVTLSTAQLPSHTHKLLASNSTGNTNNPSGASLASNSNTFTSSTANAVLSSSMVGSSGSSQPVAIMPPYLAMNWCICLYGIYPSRS